MTSHPLDDQITHLVTMLVVDDMEESLAFYQDKLGFEVLDQSPEISLLRGGAALFYFFTESPPTPDKPGLTLANMNTANFATVVIDLHVRDCRQSYQTLTDLGVEFLTPPHEPPWGGLRCFAKDPNGYLIELEEDPASPLVKL